MVTINDFGQPIGPDLADWEPPPPPPGKALPGRTVTLEPLEWVRHGGRLFEVLSTAGDDLWTYMTFGPFADISELEHLIADMGNRPDWVPYALVVDGDPAGFASYLRIQPQEGVIEIGSIVFSPRLQRTTAATESIYLMMLHVFELGYRRCEWKCDALNEPSRSAALRLGFSYDGTFRNATHYKGRNRDTAWYSMVADDWPRAARGFHRWLSPENFDQSGGQIRTLMEMREK